MKSITNFKRGDTLSLTITYSVNSVASSVANTEIASQVRTSGGLLVATMSVTKADQTSSPGVFTLAPVEPDTSNWPLGTLVCDIQFSENGVIRSTETFGIVVIRDVTR